ncbi:MAG: hypothetical protein GTO41_00535, partial [Burkholderiales bacterium]|nr:hypothetical protein [Burkholderiales bacterium]
MKLALVPCLAGAAVAFLHWAIVLYFELHVGFGGDVSEQQIKFIKVLTYP